MPTILIADDNSDLRDILSELLSIHGYSVLAACDGEDAWDLLQTNHTDLVLSDVDMPRLDGIALCNRLHDSPAHHHMPMILISGKPPAIKPINVFGILAKPMQSEALLSAIDDALGRACLRS